MAARKKKGKPATEASTPPALRRRGAPTRDLALAFEPGHTFRTDDTAYRVRVVDVGTLVTPTGKVFAADPFVFHRAVPFERKVRPGGYPVSVSVTSIKYKKSKGHDQQRVAAAMVRFAKGTPARWINATKRGQKLSSLGPDEAFGYGVDAGTGCFADVTAAEALIQLNDVETANENWEGWLLPRVGAKLGAPSWGAAVITVPKTKANIVAFPSGWGDGFYFTYWGLAKSGAPLCLVTDFGVYPDASG